MFSQLLFVRLRAAEQALDAGKLDEAYRLATAADIRTHRRGATVLAGLAEKLIERAREHFRSERFAEALLDLAKAEVGGVRGQEIAELRRQVQTVADEMKRMEQSRRRRLETARAKIEAGSLAAGQAVLADLPAGDLDVRRMEREIESRQEQVERLLTEGQQMLSAGQMSRAVERLLKAKSLDPRTVRVITMEADVCSRMLREARDALEAGRALAAADALATLRGLEGGATVRVELESALDAIRLAAQALRGGKFDEARGEALRLQHLLPDVEWVKRAVTQLKQAGELVSELAAGPLGMEPGEGRRATELDGVIGARRGAGGVVAGRGSFTPGAMGGRLGLPEVGRAADRKDDARRGLEAAPTPLADTVPVPARRGLEVRDPRGGLEARGPGAALPDRLLMLVDGGGSYLFLRGERIAIGRAASDDPADVPIVSDLAERHAEVSRVEDDYFLLAARAVEVGGRATQHHLLRDGDRVVLGRKAKFTFRQPSRKSGSAVLDLSDTSKLPNDVRRVVLFRGNATIGFGPTVHVSCKSAERTLVLFERAGSLWIRPQGLGEVQTEARPIELGRTMEIGNISFVIEPWRLQIADRRLQI